MAAVGPPVVSNDIPPMAEAKVFFKALSPINYFSDEAEAEAIENDVAFQHFNRSLECSNKYGCVLFAFNKSFCLIRVSDIMARQSNLPMKKAETLLLQDLKRLDIQNDAISVTPNIVVLSSDEEYLAVDTVRGDSAWVVVFKLSDFIAQGGACRPVSEIRCSPSGSARVSEISWNPGENMNNLVAINVEDGNLFLAKIVGPNNVELNKFAQGGVRCLCWSPKGKQLVIGRSNGNISQLKLDLTEAKQIPGPAPGSIPISILWTQTTQFLILFHREDYIEFMQLDLAKSAPPTYTNSGDVFISDVVHAKSSCFFIPVVPWNAVIAATNTATDVVVLVKTMQGQSEYWSVGDIPDNRRAAFVLDHCARGAAIYYGSEDQVILSEVEAYRPMPMIFLLSQRGSISVYSLVNSDPQTPSLNVKVTSPVPDSVFSKPSVTKPKPAESGGPVAIQQPTSATPSPVTFQQIQRPVVQSPFGQMPQAPSAAVPTAVRPQQDIFKPQTTPQVQFGGFPVATQKPLASSTLPKPSIDNQVRQLDPRQLATSTLPTPKDMASLLETVEEKRREMTSHLQKSSLKGLEDDEQCILVMTEIRKFERRLSEFREKLGVDKSNLNVLLNTSFEGLEKRVLTTLNLVEDFVSDMVSTTNAQKEEVDVLKERILNHFSQLEYAKSVVERSRDPRYLEHLRSRPLDPASQQRFQEIKKLHNYITNQVAECRRYFYEQGQKRDTPFDRIPLTQLIYLTLSNHSQIIRRLNTDLDRIKSQLGLGKNITAFDEAEFLTVETSYCGRRKADTSSDKRNDDIDDITLSDLTAGISKVKLNRESDLADRKPVRFANKKLFMLKKCMSEVAEVKVKAEESPWTRVPSKPTRPKSVTYPTAPLESSISKMMESALQAEDVTPSKPISVIPTAKNASTVFASAASLAGLTPSAQAVKSQPPAPVNPIASFGQVGSTPDKHVESSFSSFPKPSTPPITTVPKPIAKVSTPPNAPVNQPTSLSTQLPTLTGLLSSPPSGSSNSGFASGLSSSGSASAGGLFSGIGLSLKDSTTVPFGTGLFSTGPQPNTSTPVKSGGPKPTAQTANFSTGSATGGIVNPAVAGVPASVPKVAPATNLMTATTSTPSLAHTAISTRTNVSGAGASLFTTPPAGTTITFGATTIPPNASLTTKTVTTSSGLFATPIVSATSAPSSGNLANPTVASSSPFTGIFTSSPVSFATPAKGSTIFGDLTVGNKKSEGTTSDIAPSSTPPPRDLTVTAKPLATGNPPVVESPSNTVVATAVTTSTPVVSVPSIATSVTATPPTTSAPTGGANLFSSSIASPNNTASKNIFGGGGLFGTPSSTGGGLFGSTAITTATTSSSGAVTVTPVTSSSIFPPTSSSDLFTAAATLATSSSGLFSSNVTTSTGPVPSDTTSATSVSTTGGLFSSVPIPSTTTGGLFSSVLPATTTGSSIFSTPPVVSTSPSFAPSTITTESVPSGIFQVASPTTLATTTTAAPAGFMSALSLSESANKTSGPGSTPGAGLFSSPFGSTTSAPSIFGGSSTTGAFATTQSSQSPGFNQAKPAAASIFGGSTAGANPVFGGSATFGSVGSTSPFGSSFGSSGGSTFGGGSVFGSAATTSQTSTFGTLSQAGTTAFGGSPFGSGVSGQQQASVFGSTTPQKPASATGGGLFSSANLFSTPTSTSAGSIFGGSGGSVFGAPPVGSGSFSAGANSGGVAQQGFGFGQAKPATGTVFGSPSQPGTTTSPVFGGGATFGSTSPFGSSFGGSPSFASGGSVFGGAAPATQTTGFAALAQGSPTGFGGGATGFGGQTQQTSPFGAAAPQQQQQSKPVFGGQAFSSWR